MTRRVMLAVCVCLLGALMGCPTGQYARCPEQFMLLPQLVADHNANARRVQRLWARARVRFSAQGLVYGSASALAAPNALLLLSKAQAEAGTPDFVLIGRDVVELFRLGIDARAGLYYFWANVGNSGGARFGRTRYAGAPAVEGLSLDPTQLVEVLGVTELPAVAPDKLPAVVMQMQGRPRPAYVVRYLKPQPVTGYLKLWREVYFTWEKDIPPRPFRVRLFDAAGFCRVTADLADYKPIATGEQDVSGPIMPTDIRMTWPAIKNVQEAATLHIRLSDMSTAKPFLDSVFGFREHLPGGLEPVQLDSAYGQWQPAGEDR